MQKQFVLKSQEGNPIPRIINWYGKVDIRKLNRREYRQLPSYFLLEMKTGMDVLYPDILLDPVFLVSREMMEILVRYDEELPFLFVALFEVSKEESRAYFCPMLEESRSLQDKPIYRLLKEDSSEIRIRLDLAEGIMAREGVGIALEEGCIYDEEK